MLRLAEEMFYMPKWSAEIISETQRTLEKFGYSPQQSQRRADAMMLAFPEAMVVGYEQLTDAMRNDPKDRHVLAAAVRGRAHCIVTSNKKHFPADSLLPYDIECLSPDEFLQHQYHLDTDRFISILAEQARETRRSLPDLLSSLTGHLPMLCALIKP
jgi:predicted nucleic acid-binding protein